MAEVKKAKRKAPRDLEINPDVKEKKEKKAPAKSIEVNQEPANKKSKKEANAEKKNDSTTDVQSPIEKKKKKKHRVNFEDLATPKVEHLVFDDIPSKKFVDFELDERILKGVGELGWTRPTEVQMSMIELALEGRNIMARARTGSGKTAAFVLPILHRVVQVVTSSKNATSSGPLAIFIAPTKELTSQAANLLRVLLKPLPFVSLLNLAELSESEKSVWDNDQPDMVVATPGKLSTILRSRPQFLSNIRHVVLDEADLLLSFGYEDEIKFIRRSLPPLFQCIMTSATLTDDMTSMKKLMMPGPAVTIKLKEGDLPDATQLTQYQISCENDEQRFAILLALVKLKLILGKTIIFVNTVERCYRLGLFLQGFNIKSCILNASMPANSRCYVIDQFNKGEYSIVVASDASDVHGMEQTPSGEEKTKKKKHVRNKGPGRMDKESGVARGIDFHQVSNVINFDFPTSLDSYIHKVGRTARGFNKGTALSFCTPPEQDLLNSVRAEMTKQMGQDILSPYEMRIRELDSFLLRAREALAACTKLVIKEARLEEIRQEALRSTKLQAYFAKNPREKEILEKDKKLRSLKLYTNAIADVPDYIVPKALRGMDFSDEQKKKHRGTKHRRMTNTQKKTDRRQSDPLRSFTF